MNRFQRWLATRVLGIKAASLAAGSYDTRSHEFAAWASGGPTYAGKNVSESSAMQVSVAFACIRVLAETIGGLPRHIYRMNPDGSSERAPTHPLDTLLSVAPNDDMTGVEFMEALVTMLALRGNFYARKYRNKTSVVALYPIAGSVQPRRGVNGEVYYRVTKADGTTEDLARDDVWHVKGFGPDGLVGLSPLSCAKQALGTALAVEEFQARFFANGANPSWLISIPQWLEKDQRVVAREQINSIWQGVDNAHRAVLLEGGMTATAATMPLEDAQFMQLRGFGIQEICRIYRVPPHMVADLSRSTNNNIEQQSLEFVTYTLTPYLTRTEMSAARWLMPPEERSQYFLKFNVEGLLRADAKARADLYSSGVQNGWLTRNEVRALENRNASDEPGMDDFTVQTNLAPIDRLGEAPADPQSPKPAAEVAQSMEQLIAFSKADRVLETDDEGMPVRSRLSIN